jgi:hypothetical protein
MTFCRKTHSERTNNMTDQIFALPIKGESFLMRRRGKSVLVDGGHSGNNLVREIALQDPELQHNDIVVCTHADQDHAGGLATFLDRWTQLPIATASTRTVGQFWLPGCWAKVLPPLMRNPRKFVDELIVTLDQQSMDFMGGDIDDPDDLEQQVEQRLIGERNAKLIPDPVVERPNDTQAEIQAEGFDPGEPDLDTTEPTRDPDWFADLRNDSDQQNKPPEEAERAFQSGERRIGYRRRRRSISIALATYWLGLIKTARNIRAIAQSAIRYNARVRWFDFEEFSITRIAKGGVRNFLVPLNAVEQARPAKVDANLTYLAFLTAVNRECLVFFAPPFIDRMGVIFCGDSPLGDGSQYRSSFLKATPKPQFPIIATAPHHGAESNQVAYAHLSNWANVFLWIRTGGSSKHPGNTFKTINSSERICTHCPYLGLKLVPAGVTAIGVWPYWYPMWLRGHQCACR